MPENGETTDEEYSSYKGKSRSQKYKSSFLDRDIAPTKLGFWPFWDPWEKWVPGLYLLRYSRFELFMKNCVWRAVSVKMWRRSWWSTETFFVKNRKSALTSLKKEIWAWKYVFLHHDFFELLWKNFRFFGWLGRKKNSGQKFEVALDSSRKP